MAARGTLIHATAVVDPGVELGEGVEIGAFTHVAAGARIGDRTRIGSHCSVGPDTTIGADNHFHGHAAIGGAPQDKKYRGERVALEIGDRNQVREFATLNRGTGDGGGVTRIGNDNWLLAYVHVAHDCVVGDHCVFSNNTTLAGHVEVGDWVIISGFAGAHQFCRIGAHAFLGMGALLNGDVPPFTLVASDDYGRPRGINSEGLKRRGFDADRIAAIKRAYRALYVSGDSLAEAKVKLAALAADSDDVRAFLEFIERGQRPLAR